MDLYARFWGEVQGVGFRATARHLASRFAITGTVKNMADGSVELYAQGTKESVDAFLASLQAQFRAYLQSVDIQTVESSKSFSEFRIIF